MHRARSAFSLAITPIGQQGFGAWLLQGANKSKVSGLFFSFTINDIVYFTILYLHLTRGA